MQENQFTQEIIQYSGNFRWDSKRIQHSLAQDLTELHNFEILHDFTVEKCKSDLFQQSGDNEKIEVVLDTIFRCASRTKEEQQLCSVVPELFQIGKFLTLCTFLHNSKKIKGESIKNFVHHNSPMNFSDCDSPNHSAAALEESEVDRFRKSRMRLLSQGKVYIKNTQWNAISRDSAYEWGFYFDLQNEPCNVQDVAKRLKNLYSGIYRVLRSDANTNFTNRVLDEYESFVPRLKKISYENYLQLIKTIKTRILSNKEYYGINLYRLEKRLHPNIITNTVKRLEQCISNEEEIDLLMKSVYLDEVCFPMVYKKLLSLPLESVAYFAEIYPEYLARIQIESCMILDELIDRNLFSPNWENLFRCISNELAESILYNLESLDFSTTVNSQQKFLRILNACVVAELAPYFESGDLIEKLML